MRNHGLFAALLVTGVLGVSGCSKQHEGDTPKAVTPVVVKGITVETVKSAALPELLEVSGTVRSRTSAIVSPRVPGSIAMLRVREGDRVKKGQLLIQLDAQENQATAAVASAGIDEARRGLDEAQSRKKLADATFERYHNLYKEQAVSRQEFDVKLSEKELAAGGVARAESRLKQAQEGSRAAAAVADYTKILAPISGVIAVKQTDLGATVFPGQPLLTIEDDGGYQLELALPESMAAKVKPGSTVQVSLDALGSTFTARVTEIVPAADPASRTFTAKIPLTQKGLKSGMFGRGSLPLGTAATGITIARKALVEKGALTSVWVVDKDNNARMRLVKAGKTTNERTEILSGLADGERIISSGIEKIAEGNKVE